MRRPKPNQSPVTSGYRRGGDAYVTENGGGPGTATSGGNGVGSSLDAIWGGTSGATNQAIVLKFDLSQIVPGTITDASLQLTASTAISGTRQFKVFALEHDAPGWDWNEASVEFNAQPGMTFDQNSRTLGLSSSSTNIPTILTMGTITVGSMTAGQTVNFRNANLEVFLNLAQYFEDTDQRGLVTLLLEPTSSSTVASFYSREGSLAQVGDESLAPRLVLQATGVPGDFNHDGNVDASRLRRLAQSLGTTYTQDDYNMWRSNFGKSDASGLGASANTGVPEPGTGLMLLMGALAMIVRRRTRVS